LVDQTPSPQTGGAAIGYDGSEEIAPMKVWYSLFAVTVFVFSAAAFAESPMTPPQVQDLVARAKPSVVVITFTGRDGDRQGLGSGVIIDGQGLIATNLHVIGEARPIRVQLADGRAFDVVSIEAMERHHDLALLRIDARDLPALPLGDSDSLQEGEPVVAIGNPLGLERSVVSGVLSGKREVEGRPMLQLAMPIERGNSGGPLLDLQGRVIGLITLKSAKTENLGFAAPINQLKPLLARPNPIPMEKWLTIGVLDPAEWTPLPGGRWRQRAGRILADGRGTGLGARALCLSTTPPPEPPFEVAVDVRFTPWEGAAGLVFHADGGDRHYGFYPSHGELRLSRFEGPDVYAWTVLQQVRSPSLRKEGWNSLKVRIERERILCYVNDQLVIESNDRGLTSGRVGLCKFRQTEAEFRRFRVAAEIPPREPSSELMERVAEVTQPLKVGRPIPPVVVETLLPEGAAGLEALEREAVRLEQRAAQLRRLALAVHDRRVRAEWTRVTDAPDEQIDLVRGALVIAWADNPDLDIDAYMQEIDRIVRRVRQKLAPEASELERLHALKRDLFEEQGFHGSRHDYGHRSNSYLNEVLDDREGLPITLSVLFMEVARKLDVPVVGIGLPGHFVVRYYSTSGPGAMFDVFDRGKELSIEAAKAKVAANTDLPWDDKYLEPASRRAILSRMLRNLFSEARQAEEPDRMLRYIELLLILQPDSALDRFYRSVLCLQTGQLEQARADAEWLLQHQPPELSRETIEDLAREISRAGQQAN
jgi:regulator of sirC expression with transglutaminase-like and TPR domain